MLATEGSKNELGGTQRREGKTVLSHSHHLGEAPSSTLHTIFDSNVAKVIHYRGITKEVIKLSISFKKKIKAILNSNLSLLSATLYQPLVKFHLQTFMRAPWLSVELKERPNS